MSDAARGGRVAPALGAALAAVMVLLALAATAPAAPAVPAVPAGSFLATGSGGLQLAVVLRDGRIQAFACDGLARRAFFSGRAGRTLRSAAGDTLVLRRAGRGLAARLTLAGGAASSLTARQRRVAIFTTTIDADGAVIGTARGGGVLGANVSATRVAGALAFPHRTLHAFTAASFALAVDGAPVPFAPEALHGEWRWIVTPRRILGATLEPAGAGVRFVRAGVEAGRG